MAIGGEENLSQKAFLGRGWAFPVATDPLTGTVAAVAFEADIRQAIWIVLATRRGERVMRPGFGCGIHDLVFETIEQRTLARVAHETREALIEFEPRIELIEVVVAADRALDGVLEIGVDYRVRRTNQMGNLVYPFYFQEGGRS